MGLADAGVAHLGARSEGWAAGAQILLRDGAATGGAHNVLEWLRRSVLGDLEPDVQTFLRRTSILGRLSGPLCDSVAETTGSTARLADLSESGTFVVPLSGNHEYRYQRLFAEALQLELERVEPGPIGALHLRASVWFERAGDHESAVSHGIAARDVSRASELVATHAAMFVKNGQGEVVTRWLQSLSWPDAVADPQLAILRVADAARGHDASASDIERWLTVAEADWHGDSFDPPALGAASLESASAILRSLYLSRSLTAAEGEARRALELERSPPGWRADALAALGQALFLLGRNDEARAVLEESRRVPGAHGEHAAAPIALGVLSLVELDDGNLVAADYLARDATSGAGVERVETNAGIGHIALGCVAFSQGRLSLGVSELERAIDEVVPKGPSLWRAYALLHLARAEHARGARRDARQTLESARQLLAQETETGVVGRLFVDTERRVVTGHADSPSGAPLTKSELRVLRLFELGLSRGQVAAELFVTSNTVKTHSRSIYRKLGVTSRGDAVARADELGLL
jgi:LuxR family maltose regulon positive regulatory protein